MNRRLFLKYGCSSVLLPFAMRGNAAERIATSATQVAPVCTFVKPLEKYSYDEIATLLYEAGFDGADITFRKNGLIDPAQARQQMPRLITSFRDKGLTVPMAVTGITDPAAPGVEEQVRIMADYGVRYYRLGYYRYDSKLSIPGNQELFKRQLSGLQEINARYNMHGAIQNHVGTALGAAVWDAYEVIKELDPKYIGFQYDIRHAMAEGMESWPLGMRLISGYAATTCIKDFTWIHDGKRFKPQSVPLGEGIIDFGKYFAMTRELSLDGPVSIHYEFPLLTAGQKEENKNKQMQHIIAALRKDLKKYKELSK